MPGKGALVAPACLQSDLAERQVRLAQQSRRLVEPKLVEQLQGAHLEEAANVLLELIEAQSRMAGDVFDAETRGEVILHII